MSAADQAPHPVPDALEALRRVVSRPEGRAGLLARIDGFISYADGSDENLERARALIRDGHVPVLYANHQSHADKLVLSGVVQGLARRAGDTYETRFVVPVAATIGTGAQGSYVQRLLSLFEPLYTDRGFGPDVPFITQRDREARGVEGSNAESVRRLLNAPREGNGMVIFPEATLTGGRRGPDGSVNGIQEVTPTTGSGLIGYPRSWRKRRLGEAVFLPVGIHGSYRLYPPDPGRSEISPRVLTDILTGAPTEALVVVAAGSPFTYAELEREAGEELDAKDGRHLGLMMAKVARLVPAAERGYYGRD